MYDLQQVIKDFSALPSEERARWLMRARRAALTTYRRDEGLQMPYDEALRFHRELQALEAADSHLSMVERIRSEIDAGIQQYKEGSRVYYSAFISYGGPDENFASRLHATLEKSGVHCWFFPSDSIPGKKLHRTMRDGVNNCDKVILVCSKVSLDRPGVLTEVEETLSREARDGGVAILVPITLDDHVYSDWAPLRRDIAQALRDRVIADFRNSTSDETKFQIAIERLLSGLRKDDAQ